MKSNLFHGLLFTVLSVLLLYAIHHLHINHIFIDPFSEAIKNYDVTDIAMSNFRDHDEGLFDNRVVIVNSQVTDREEIATSLEYILNDGAKAVGMDLLFDSLNYTKSDSLLSKSFSDERVVLGFSYHDPLSKNGHSHDSGPEHLEYKDRSHQFFRQNANEAFVNFATNDKFTVRIFKPKATIHDQDYYSLGVELAAKKHPKVKDVIKNRHNKKEWINFRRIQPGEINMSFPINPDSLIHYQMISAETLVENPEKFSEGFFKDKIVLFGFSGENEKAQSMKDRYFTPMNYQYFGRSIPDMHGVVIHANIVSMMLDEDFINEVSESRIYILTFLIYFINFFIFKILKRRKLWFTVLTVRLIQIIEFILLFAICIALLANQNLKIAFVLPITAVILSFELFEFYEHKLAKPIEKMWSRSTNQEITKVGENVSHD